MKTIKSASKAVGGKDQCRGCWHFDYKKKKCEAEK